MEGDGKLSGLEMLDIASESGINTKGIDPNELEIGYGVEKEHGKTDKDTNVTDDDVVKTIKVAIAHLREKPNYYSLLNKYVENKKEEDMLNESNRFKQLIGLQESEGKYSLNSEKFKDNTKDGIILRENYEITFDDEVKESHTTDIHHEEEGDPIIHENEEDLNGDDLFEIEIEDGDGDDQYGKYQDDILKKKAEKQNKIHKLERELFYDIIRNLIDSNNVDKMNEYVDYMTGKLSLSLNQFIHQQIYRLKDKNIEAVDINIDYNDLNKRIDLFKKKVEKL